MTDETNDEYWQAVARNELATMSRFSIYRSIQAEQAVYAERQLMQAKLACSHARIAIQFLIAREPGIADTVSVQGALASLDHVLGSHRP